MAYTFPIRKKKASCRFQLLRAVDKRMISFEKGYLKVKTSPSICISVLFLKNKSAGIIRASRAIEMRISVRMSFMVN